MQMSHMISEVTWPKFTKFVAMVIFLLMVLTKQSMLQSIHQLSNNGRQLKKAGNIGKT